MGFGGFRTAFLLLVLSVWAVSISLTCGASGTISGSITDANTGLGFPVCAEVYDDQGVWVVNACPPDGIYTTPPLDPGTYYVATNNWSGHYDEVWEDILCNPMCDVTIGIPIVIASDPVTGIDFDLAPGGGWFSGMLTDESNGNGIAFTPVFVYDSVGDEVGFGWVNPPGLYTTKGALETGTYFAVTSPDLFLGELYDDFPCPETNCDPTTGTPITVSAGSGTPGIDFFLLPVFIFGDGFESGSTSAWSSTSAYMHTITIDGINDFSLSDEQFSTTTVGYTAYLTWDGQYLFIGLEGQDLGPGSSAEKFVLIYIGGADGTTTGQTYNNQLPTLAFEAKYHIRWRTDGGYTNAQVWSASWTDAGWDFSGDVARIGYFLEMRLPLADIGNPSLLRVHISLVNEASAFEWTYSGVPATSFNDGFDPDYNHYFAFDQGSSQTPSSYSPR